MLTAYLSHWLIKICGSDSLSVSACRLLNCATTRDWDNCLLERSLVQFVLHFFVLFQSENKLIKPKYIDKSRYNRCGEVVVRLLSPLWQGYHSCGEIILACCSEITNLWRDYLRWGYLVARLRDLLPVKPATSKPFPDNKYKNLPPPPTPKTYFCNILHMV